MSEVKSDAKNVAANLGKIIQIYDFLNEHDLDIFLLRPRPFDDTVQWIRLVKKTTPSVVANKQIPVSVIFSDYETYLNWLFNTLLEMAKVLEDTEKEKTKKIVDTMFDPKESYKIIKEDTENV